MGIEGPCWVQSLFVLRVPCLRSTLKALIVREPDGTDIGNYILGFGSWG